jgi:hypothetical protein
LQAGPSKMHWSVGRPNGQKLVVVVVQ